MAALFWIVFGAEEWRCYLESCLVLKSDGAILDCVWCRRVAMLFRIVFGAEEWRRYLGSYLLQKSGGVI